MGRPPCCDKSNVKRGLWTPEEDAKLLAHVANLGTGNWTLVPKKAGSKNLPLTSCLILHTKKLHSFFFFCPFSLTNYIYMYILHAWSLVSGLNRCGKSCRLRWTNYLRPDLRHASFTPHEEEIIINLHKAIGSR